MKLLELLKKSSEYLDAEGIDDALADAEMIVFHAAGTDRLNAYMNNPEVSSADAAKAKRSLRRRVKGEPVQYIIGHVEFFNMKMMVGRGVLIPRPETELLVDEAIKAVISYQSSAGSSTAKPLSVLDLCTGSGCIAIALAKAFPDAHVTATDISAKALGYAKKNAELNSINNISFLRGSLFSPVTGKRFDIITSNPPYIKKGELDTLQREIRDWEPVSALDGGQDGMDFYRAILLSAVSHLNPGGRIILELGYDQAEEVKMCAEASGFRNAEVVNDYSGIGRILKAEAP